MKKKKQFQPKCPKIIRIRNTLKFKMLNYLLTKWQTNIGTPIVSLPVYFPFFSVFIVYNYMYLSVVIIYNTREKKIQIKKIVWKKLRKGEKNLQIKFDDADGHMNSYNTNTK